MIAKRLGYSVVLLERGQHPRVVIGESSTPLANLLLEELCRRYDLPAIAPLAKWGSWQRNYPYIGCGLKRGFTFYHRRLDKPDDPNTSCDNQLLVAASPHDEIADTHWYRADFDSILWNKLRNWAWIISTKHTLIRLTLVKRASASVVCDAARHFR